MRPPRNVPPARLGHRTASGYGSVVGAGSVVTKDVPPRVVAFGAPCRPVRPITDGDLKGRQGDGS